MVISRWRSALSVLLCLIISVGWLVSNASATPKKAIDPNDGYVSIVKRPSHHLLYRLEHPHTPASYVFGTFHSDSPKLNDLFMLAARALARSKMLLVEIAVDKHSRSKALQYLTFPPSHPGLHSVIPRALYEDTVVAASSVLKLTEADVDRYKPWALAVILQYPKSEADGVVLDEKLQKLATSQQVSIHGLETLEGQLKIFDGMRPKDQVSLLEFNVAEMDGLAAQQQTLTELYLSQNITGIEQLSKRVFEEMSKQAPEVAAHLKQELIVKRNLFMVNKAVPYMRRQPVLMAVGALHLPGEDGILAQFEKRGFRVYAVDESQLMAAPAADAGDATPKSADTPADTPADATSEEPTDNEPLSELMKDPPAKDPKPAQTPAPPAPAEATPPPDKHSMGAGPAPRKQPAF